MTIKDILGPIFFGVRITPFLLFSILLFVGTLYEYLELKHKLKISSGREYKEYLIGELNSFWKIPCYFIVVLLVFHFSSLRVLY